MDASRKIWDFAMQLCDKHTHTQAHVHIERGKTLHTPDRKRKAKLC